MAWLAFLAVLATAVAPAVNDLGEARLKLAEDKLLEAQFPIDSPFLFRGEGFWFQQTTLNTALAGCLLSSGKETKDPRCPSYDVATLSKVANPRAPEAGKVGEEQFEQLGKDLVTFGAECLGPVERRFRPGFCDADGILFVQVFKQFDFCNIFAKTFPYYANQAAMFVAMPRLGLAFEAHGAYAENEAPEPIPEGFADAYRKELDAEFTAEEVAAAAAALKEFSDKKQEIAAHDKKFAAGGLSLWTGLDKAGRTKLIADARAEAKEEEEDGGKGLEGSSSSSSSSSSRTASPQGEGENREPLVGKANEPEDDQEDLLAVSEHVVRAKSTKRRQPLHRYQALMEHHSKRNPFLSGDVYRYPGDATTYLPWGRLIFHRIKFAYEGGVSDMSKIRFSIAMKAWEAKTCVSFREVRWDAARANVDLKLYSDLGAGGPLAWGIPLQVHTNPATCDQACVTHEFGHVLGLAHVQQREDRDVYIEVDQAEAGGNWAQFEQASEVNAGAHRERHYVANSDLDDVGLFDWNSIMLYGPMAGNSHYNVPVMRDRVIGPFDRALWRFLGQPDGLPPHAGTWGFANNARNAVSDMDAFIVNAKYHCFPRDANGDAWTPGANPRDFNVCTARQYRDGYTDDNGDVIPLCREKKDDGAICARSAECSSNRCFRYHCHPAA